MNTPRPVPIITDELTFSRKKKSLTNDSLYAPLSPVKSAPPVSRIFRQRKGSTPGAHTVSFRKAQTKGDVNVQSPFYTTFDQLYFDQCFTKLSKVGVGSFGEVWKVQSKEDGRLYAVKKSRECFRGDFDRKQRLEEVNKNERVQGHPNCVCFYKAWEELDYLYIQSELCEMSLKDYVEKVHFVEEKEIWNMIVDLCHGLKHLHDSQLAHMDIKPANLFLGRDGRYKIGDFGLVVELTHLGDAMDGDSKYMAPELMEGNFSKAADIFSLGITILELACSLELPKGGHLWQQLRKKELPFEFTAGLSDDLIVLISSMMDPDPVNRPTVDDILNMQSVVQAAGKKPLQNSSYASIISLPLISFWMYLVCLFTSIVNKFNASNCRRRQQQDVHIPVHRSRTPTPVPFTKMKTDSSSCTPSPVNTSHQQRGHESLLTQCAATTNTSVFTSPRHTPLQRKPVISPLFNRNSPLFQPVSNKKEKSKWSKDSPYDATPTNETSFGESPRMAGCESSPQGGTGVSERIVRSRLFTCSSDEDDDFDLQKVPKNLMSSFKDDDWN